MHSKTLLSILKPLAPAIDAKPVLPICESVVVKQNRAYATNTQLSISNKCELPDMVLPYAQLTAILSVINEEIEIKDTPTQYIVQAGSKKFPIAKSYDANLFPEIPIIAAEQTEITSDDLFAIQQAAKNTSAEELSQWKNIFIGNEFIVGNDNFAMFKYTWESKLNNIAVPKMFARAIAGQGSGSIAATEKHLLFRSGELEIIITLAESNFPKFDGIFPQFKPNLSVIRGDFEIALKQISVTNPQSISLHINKDECNFSSSNGEFVDCAAKTDLNMEVTFNPTILARIISSLPDDCDTLNIMITGETTAAYIQHNNITLLIMPFRK